MTKSPDAFRTISEVAEWMGVQAHVLRFWESKFSQVKPVKRAGGRRYYRPADMLLLGGIKTLLHDEGLTIKGVQKLLREQGVAHVSDMSQPLEETAAPYVADIESTVVAFESAAAESEVLAQAEDLETSQDDEPLPPKAEPEEPALQEQLPLEPTAEPEPVPEPEPEPALTMQEPEEPEPDIPPLPSFLHRSVQPASEPKPQEKPALRAIVVDAPDPPPLDEIPYVPSVLARLAKIDRLSPDHAKQIAPVAEELKAWLSRCDDAGPA